MKNEELNPQLGDYLDHKRYVVVDVIKGVLFYKEKKDSHTVKKAIVLQNCGVVAGKKDARSINAADVPIIAIREPNEDPNQANHWNLHLNAGKETDQSIRRSMFQKEGKKIGEKVNKLFTVEDDSDSLSGETEILDKEPTESQVENILKGMSLVPDDYKMGPIPGVRSSSPTANKLPTEEDIPSQTGHTIHTSHTSHTIHTSQTPISSYHTTKLSSPKAQGDIGKSKIITQKTEIVNIAADHSKLVGRKSTAEKLKDDEGLIIEETKGLERVTAKYIDKEEEVGEGKYIPTSKLNKPRTSIVDEKIEETNYPSNFELIRFQEFEDKDWMYNRQINDCRVHTERILLPKDLHNPVTPLPTKQKKSAKLKQKLLPFSQLLIDILIISLILYILNYVLEAKTGYNYESICLGIVIAFIIFKIIMLLLAQNILSKYRNKEKREHLKQSKSLRSIDEFWIKVEKKVGDIKFQDLIDRLVNLKHRKAWERGVENISEEKADKACGSLKYTYVLNNLRTLDVSFKRAHYMSRNQREFILIEENNMCIRAFKMRHFPNDKLSTITLYCCFLVNSLDLYPSIPIFLDSFSAYIGSFTPTYKETPQKPKTTHRLGNSKDLVIEEQTLDDSIFPGFDLNKFPFFIKNENTRRRIKAILKAQILEIPSDIYGSKITNPLYERLDMKFIPIGRKSIKAFLSFLHKDQWDMLKNKETYSLYSHFEQGKIALKSICTIPFTPLEVLEFILNLDKKKQLYNGYLKESKIALRLPKNTAIIHEQMERQWPVFARDYAILLHYNLNSNGSIHLAFSSTEHSSVPVNKANLRGKIEIGGWALERGGERETIATYAIKMQITGSITRKLFVNYLKKNDRKTPYKIKVAMNKLYSE